MSDLSTMTREDKLILAEAIAERNRRRARVDCKFFINEFLKTFDPRPDVFPHDMDFDLYRYEENLVDDLLAAIEKGIDEFIEKSRDMGISWTTLAVIFWCWCFMPGFQALVGSRKEAYVDNGQLDSLFGKFDYFIEHVKDPRVLPKSIKRTFMKLVNEENGNTIQGESANKNFSRSGRYTVVFFDEFAFWPDARRSWTAAGDAAKCRIAVTTPPDEPSFAKVIRFGDKIKVTTLHWRLHPKKDQQWYDYECARRTEDEILHELDISWEYASTGRPYPEIDNLEFGQYPYDPNAPLYSSLDLGLDAIAAGWYQPVPNSDWLTLVDCYEVYDKVIDWFMPFFGKDIDSRYIYTDTDLEMIKHVKLWKPPILYGDPSGNARHVESDISPYRIMQNYGLHVQVNNEENDWPTRRDQTKKIFMRLRVNDTPRTRWWKECLKSARYPKRDEETTQTTTPITKPVHDWTSHHRTQTEFFSVNYSPARKRVKPRERKWDPITGRMLSS